VSVVYGRGSLDGPYASLQTIWQLMPNGDATEVAWRELAHDYPMAYRHYGWWLSPAMHWLSAQARTLLTKPNPLEQRDPPTRPAEMYWLAGALMLLSVFASFWMTGTRALPALRRWLWIVACALVGIPALVAFWLMHPERRWPSPSVAEVVVDPQHGAA